MEEDMNFQNFAPILCSTPVSSEDEGEDSFVLRITLQGKGEEIEDDKFQKKRKFLAQILNKLVQKAKGKFSYLCMF